MTGGVGGLRDAAARWCVRLALAVVRRAALDSHRAIVVQRIVLCQAAGATHRLAALDAGRAARWQLRGEKLHRRERDLHDGPQQRALRLGWQLGKLPTSAEPAADRLALRVALAQARDIGQEYWAVHRGSAPPVLARNGLRSALDLLTAGSPVPVRLTAQADQPLDAQLQRTAYFVVAEALANLHRHAAARSCTVDLAVLGDRLHITVVDDGCGGARLRPGHGLAGLVERVTDVGGVLQLSSPAGGPTRLTAELPVRSAG